MPIEKYPADQDIDRICDEFERRFEHGSPDLGEYLQRVDELRRPQLLYWLLTICSSRGKGTASQLDGHFRTQLRQYEYVFDDVMRENSGGPVLPVIPGYTLVYRAERGGQGDVYRAIQQCTGQHVAIKLLASRTLDDIPSLERQQVLERLENEIRTTTSLDHPNIVKVFDAGNCECGFYFVMQWIDGGSLADRRQSLSQLEVARIIRRVADAVGRAHRMGVLHLDIKPQNILYDTKSDQPLLADFGLARLVQGKSTAGTIAGTRGFMAPEQAAGEDVDARTDIYGLGAALYNMLTDKTVYGDVSIPYDASERERWIAQSPRLFNGELNPQLTRICLRCLELNPSDRFLTCEELNSELDKFFLTDDARRIARMGRRSLATSPLFLIINGAVAIQLHLGWTETFFGEVSVWVTVFSMYAVVFFVFGSTSKLDQHSPEKLAAESLWAVWIGKLLAAGAIAASLRLLTARSLPVGLRNNFDSVEVAVLMCYPMFAALTGLVVASIAPRYWRFLYLPALLSWLSAIALMWSVSQGSRLGPVVYGCLAMGLAVIWGLKLSRLAREQNRLVGAPNLEETSDFSK